MSSTNGQMTGLEIAVVGMAGRFPGARSVDEFWRNLRDGVESVSSFTDEELEAEGVDPALFDRPDYVRAGGVLEGAEMFDAGFFGVSPREAEITDPQQRLFLECAWEALEHAGHDPEKFKGRVGVFAGTSISTYLRNIYSNPVLLNAVGGLQILIANDKDFLPTRVSYKLNLKGPSIAVQTACSSSLVAVHLACQSLLSGECEMALSGGVSVQVPQKVGYFYQEGGTVSPDGHCRAFDERARGFVGGNGVGAVVLRRLEDALRDGDTVHAIIKGSAVNNDGSLKVGFTAPSMEGQARVIRAAHLMAEVEPESISYVEAHGIGSELGDPIEVAALAHAFRASSASSLRPQSCGLGSVKTNIGHLDAAAGVASLIKAVLALRHRQLPPTLHYERPNPKIDFSRTPFYVNARLREWESNGSPRRAGVSSFGIGGTNAHVILEEAPAEARAAGERAAAEGEAGAAGREAGAVAWPEVVCVSGRSREGLRRASARLAEWLGGDGAGARFADVAYTLREGRRAWGWRRAVLARDAAEAARELGRERGGARDAGRGAQVWWLFPGQGAQYAGMGRALYERGGRFKEIWDECAERLSAAHGIDIGGRPGLSASAAEQTAGAEMMKAQILLFITEYALAEQLREWGVGASGVFGHGLGEYVAACVAGVFTLEDALSLVVKRTRLLEQYGLASAAELTEPALSELNALARGLTPRAPSLPLVSASTGARMSDEEATSPDTWARPFAPSERLGRCVGELLKDPDAVLLEFGQGSILDAMSEALNGLGRAQDVRALCGNAEGEDRSLLQALCWLWERGVEVSWPLVFPRGGRRRVPLPTYPFERQRYWIDPPRQTDAGRAEEANPAARRQTPNTRGDSGNGTHPRPSLANPYCAARGETEQRLVSIWQELLGVERVGASDNFFELGGDSLVALQLNARLTETFGTNLPLHAVLEAPTVAGLAGLIDEGARETPSRHAREEASAPPVLVGIQAGDSPRPLALVPPIGGGLFGYRALALALDPRLSVYGFQSRAFEGGELYESVEDEAAHYVEALRALQPAGPYLLGGASYGGVVAFEAAQQLLALGEEVSLLALFDAPHPSDLNLDAEDDAVTLASLLTLLVGADAGGLTPEGLRRREPRERIDFAAGHLRAAGRLPPGVDAEQARRLLRVWMSNATAMRRYAPRAYAGRLSYFRAAERADEHLPPPEVRWTDLAGEGIEIHVVPGDHFSMLAQPHVRVLAERLRPRIAEAGAAGGTAPEARGAESLKVY